MARWQQPAGTSHPEAASRWQGLAGGENGSSDSASLGREGAGEDSCSFPPVQGGALEETAPLWSRLVVTSYLWPSGVESRTQKESRGCLLREITEDLIVRPRCEGPMPGKAS